ncbi:RecQ family ATP-dependent DNA helicase [Marinobacter nauticus]|uniref:DNA 3'-5' helicase n=1 Tax=Marinobacter nauticus (strain ATCC 700491 / DSM 11845 / VT8) TaxID=351348 RepID=A1TY41_MARN8|nr:RecQ family ATP-dependent DNA helicase [Marinobacter nauticus]ABM17660.1 ATP-dependent DNA helicase, RecQ-like protein [Marinobacter nauticus VT8]
MNRTDAEALLRTAVGNAAASFRSGQWEAINALVNQRQKLLVVQRTGWGKSSVYFIATRIMRDQGYGPTIIVSPLLALMRNQIESARRLGIHAITINSTNRDQAEALIQQVHTNQVDCLLISPEKLANEQFVEQALHPILDNVGLLVVDEAHCISDWGHDFRPDYRRLLNILRQMPPNMPVLGTTATANDRVITDVLDQLGDIEVLRGPLVRDSLSLQNIVLADQASRLAWLSETIPTLQGAGIVYVLTKRDAEQVKSWLLSQGIDAKAYYSGIEHSDFENSDQYREHLEDLLLNNQLKVLVATTALGMGYDKPDLHFVIHYQTPGSIVSYYQQVGRAGRGIDESLGILLSGAEDERIHDFFRRSAFPNQPQINQVLSVLEDSDGLSVPKLEERLNMRKGQIEKVLKFLSVETPAPVYKAGSQWTRTPVAYQLDHDQVQRLTNMREQEWQEIQEYTTTSGCLMEYLRRSLDDPEAQPCGKCANCLGAPLVSASPDRQRVIAAAQFLRHSEFVFKPRVQVAANGFPQYGLRGNLPQNLRAQEGRVLSRWADAAWGGLVEQDKHGGYFRDELVDAMAEMIQQRWQPTPRPEWVTCVPSLKHPELVPDFARRLANKLGLPFHPVISKVQDNEPQKLQNNRYHQCSNLDGVFAVDAGLPSGPVLLVDDVVDSGWTMTVLAALLRQQGSGEVYPVALASSATGD